MPRIIVTSIQSLIQPVPSRERLASQTRSVRLHDTVEVESLARWLAEQGFHGTSAVELPGEFSLRGGILDIFAPDWYEPVRIELFGDEVESIRRFEVASQRSLATLDAVDITLLDPTVRETEHFTPSCRGIVGSCSWSRPSWSRRGAIDLSRLDRPQDFHAVNAVLKEAYRFPSVTAASIATASLETTCHLKIESVERFSGDIAKVRNELDSAGAGQEVYVVCQTEAEARRLADVFGETRLARDGRLHFPSAGCARFPPGGGPHCAGQRQRAVPSRRADAAEPAPLWAASSTAFSSCAKGTTSSTWRTASAATWGCQLLEKEGQTEEHLELEFHGGTKIYVPASKINLVQKYVGGSKSRPSLAHIGGRTWLRQKQAAERAVVDLASDMLDLQAIACFAAGHRISGGHGSGSRNSTPRFLIPRRPTNSPRSRRSKPTCSSRGRWIG